ncbi:hypothetical protein ACJRO7_031391 [Eucalyptus globulus]|uniref:Uncharacterized protein n=1 Tax=Eucalyptus globulus TaxID=34317 RepID=A0ABD3JGF5_EUCGL
MSYRALAFSQPLRAKAEKTAANLFCRRAFTRRHVADGHRDEARASAHAARGPSAVDGTPPLRFCPDSEKCAAATNRRPAADAWRGGVECGGRVSGGGVTV